MGLTKMRPVLLIISYKIIAHVAINDKVHTIEIKNMFYGSCLG